MACYNHPPPSSLALSLSLSLPAVTVVHLTCNGSALQDDDKIFKVVPDRAVLLATGPGIEVTPAPLAAPAPNAAGSAAAAAPGQGGGAENVRSKRKYTRGGHKKLKLVAPILESYLPEMATTSEKERQKFYAKIVALPQMVLAEVNRDEVVSWYKRARKKVRIGEDEVEGSAAGGSENGDNDLDTGGGSTPRYSGMSFDAASFDDAAAFGLRGDDALMPPPPPPFAVAPPVAGFGDLGAVAEPAGALPVHAAPAAAPVALPPPSSLHNPAAAPLSSSLPPTPHAHEAAAFDTAAAARSAANDAASAALPHVHSHPGAGALPAEHGAAAAALPTRSVTPTMPTPGFEVVLGGVRGFGLGDVDPATDPGFEAPPALPPAEYEQLPPPQLLQQPMPQLAAEKPAPQLSPLPSAPVQLTPEELAFAAPGHGSGGTGGGDTGSGNEVWHGSGGTGDVSAEDGGEEGAPVTVAPVVATQPVIGL